MARRDCYLDKLLCPGQSLFGFCPFLRSDCDERRQILRLRQGSFGMQVADSAIREQDARYPAGKEQRARKSQRRGC
jgi:hypothetical protein